MKQLNRCVCLMLVFLLACSFCPSRVPAEGAAAQAGEWDGYSYTVLEDNSACITRCTNSGEVVIPENLDGHPVTAIGERAFDRNQKVTAITVPEGVTSIGANAFYWCGHLAAVTLPDSLQQIGPEAFGMCSELKTIRLSKNHPVFEIRNGVLFNKPEKTLVFYPLTKKAPAMPFRTERSISHRPLSAKTSILNPSRSRNPSSRSERTPSTAVFT